MSLVSLRRYLAQPDANDPARKIISLLLETAVGKAARADADEYAARLSDVSPLRASVSGRCSPEELLVQIGAAAHAIEKYNDRLTRLIHQQGAELQRMIAMLTHAVVTIAGRSDQSISALENVGAGIEKATRIEDVQSLRHQLHDCLTAVCTEVARQKAETESVVRDLQMNIVHARAAAGGARDRVTGVPLQPEGEAAFARELTTPGLKYVVVIVMERLPSINTRFGYEIGDQAFRALSEHVRVNLTGRTGLLFRWPGPTLIALLPRPDALDAVRSFVRQVLDSRLQQTFEIQGRSAMISLSGSWSVVPLLPPVAEICASIQRFVDAKLPQAPRPQFGDGFSA